MNRIFALFVFSLTSTAGAVVIRHDVDDAAYRVSGTEFPALGDVPGEGHGVLIAPRWIVTAAHTIPHGSLISSTHGCWIGHVFDREPSAHARERALGDGDSGGPVLIEIEARWQLAGLAAGKLVEGGLGIFRTGLYGQTGYNVRRSSYAEWIDATMSPERQDGSDVASEAHVPPARMHPDIARFP